MCEELALHAVDNTSKLSNEIDVGVVKYWLR